MTAIALTRGQYTSKTKQEIDKNTLSYRLGYALNSLKISQSELARRLGIKPQAIQYICANNVKKSQFSFEIAEALNVSYTWLTTGQGNMIQAEKQTKKESIATYKVPILNEEQFLFHAKRELSISDESIFEYFVTNMPTLDSYVALIANDDAMNPPFPKDATLIFDTLREPKNYDFVIAHVSESNKLVFRQLIQENEIEILRPTDRRVYKDICLNKADEILGVLVQTHYALKTGQ